MDLKIGNGVYVLGLKRVLGKLENEFKSKGILFFC